MGNIGWYPGQSLEEVEKQVIEQALRFYDGNKTKTAQALGIAIRTLDSRLEKYKADSDVQHKPAEMSREIKQVEMGVDIEKEEVVLKSGVQPGKETEVRRRR